MSFLHLVSVNRNAVKTAATDTTNKLDKCDIFGIPLHGCKSSLWVSFWRPHRDSD